ncbi:Uncharacterised protein [Salmonella bongori]|nr:Uncharacterised protein [Salmonella bongori]
MAMATFTREMIALLAVWLDVGIKQNALIDKPLHRRHGRCWPTNSTAWRSQIPAPANQCIFDMRTQLLSVSSNTAAIPPCA